MTISTNIPKTLYKYRSLEKFEWIQQIFNGELYFSSPQNFNDPIDSNIPLNCDLNAKQGKFFFERCWDLIPGSNRKEKRKYISKNRKNLNSLDHNKTNPPLNNYCVYSLSANKSDWLMWTHYADGHRGLVVGFKTDNIFPGKLITNIKYEECLPNTKLSDSYEKRMESTLLTKPKVYEHEQEYRIIIHNEAEGPKKFNTSCISEIILGNKILPENISKLKNIITNFDNKPKIYKTELQLIPGKAFELILKECNV